MSSLFSISTVIFIAILCGHRIKSSLSSLVYPDGGSRRAGHAARGPGAGRGGRGGRVRARAADARRAARHAVAPPARRRRTVSVHTPLCCPVNSQLQNYVKKFNGTPILFTSNKRSRLSKVDTYFAAVQCICTVNLPVNLNDFQL